MINLKFDEKAYQEYLTKREYPSNTRIRPDDVKHMIEKLNQYLSNFPGSHGLADITANMKIMYEIAERVEKRRVYFHIFYNIKMSELNETSLLCFILIFHLA